MSSSDALYAIISPTRRATMSIAEERTQAQKNTFAKWANSILAARDLRVDELCTDFADGVLLIQLAELLTGKKAGKHSNQPKAFFAKSANLSIAFDLFHADGLRIVNIGPQDILEHNEKITLALLWSLILRYQIVKNQSDDADLDSSAKKLLLEWIRSLPNFEATVTNFNNSWTSGEALWDLVDCVSDGALSHMDRTRAPTKDIATAMGAAEEELGIPQLLSPEHMAKASDELSLMTYISFFKEKMDSINQVHAEAAKKTTNDLERDFLEEEDEEEGEDAEGDEETVAAELVNIDELGLSLSSHSAEGNDDASRDAGESSHSDQVQTDILEGESPFDSDGILEGESPFAFDGHTADNHESTSGFSTMLTSPYTAARDNALNSISDYTPPRADNYEVPPVATYESDSSDFNEPSMLSNKVISPRVGLKRPYALKEDRLSDLSATSAGQHTDTSLASHLTPRGGGGGNSSARGDKAPQLTPRHGGESTEVLTPRGSAANASHSQLSPRSGSGRNGIGCHEAVSPHSEPMPSKPASNRGRSDQEHLIGREVRNSLKRPVKRSSSAAKRRVARDKSRALHNRGRSVTLPAAHQKGAGPSKTYQRRSSLDSTLHDLLSSNGLESDHRSDVDITPAPTPSLEFDTDGRPNLPTWMTELGLLPPSSNPKTPRNSCAGDVYGSPSEHFPTSAKSDLPSRNDQKHTAHDRTMSNTASDLLKKSYDWLSQLQVDERARPKKKKAHRRSKTAAFNRKDLSALSTSSAADNMRGKPPLTPRRRKGHSRRKTHGAVPRDASQLTPFEVWCMESAEANMALRKSDLVANPTTSGQRNDSGLGSVMAAAGTRHAGKNSRNIDFVFDESLSGHSRTQSVPVQRQQKGTSALARVQSDIPTRDFTKRSSVFTSEISPTPQSTPAPPCMPAESGIRMENSLDESNLPSAGQSSYSVARNSVGTLDHPQTYTPAQTPEPFSSCHNPPRERQLSLDAGTSHEVKTPNPTPAPPTMMSPQPDEIRMENSLDESNIPSTRQNSYSAAQRSLDASDHHQTHTRAQIPEPFSQFHNPPAQRQLSLDGGLSQEVKTPNPTPAPPRSMSAAEIQRTALEVLADALLASPRFREGSYASPPPRRSLPESEQLTPIRDKVFNFPSLDAGGSDADNLPSPVRTTQRGYTLPNAVARGGIHTPKAKRSLRDAHRQLSLALRESGENQGGLGVPHVPSRDLSQHPLLMTPNSRERRRRKVLGTIAEEETFSMVQSAPVSHASSKRNSLSRPSHGRARLRARKQFADMKRDASHSHHGSDVDANMSDVSHTPDADLSSENDEQSSNFSPTRLHVLEAREKELQRKEEHMMCVQRSLELIQEMEPERPRHKLVVLKSPSLGFVYEHQNGPIRAERSPSAAQSLGVRGPTTLGVPGPTALSLGVATQEAKFNPLETPRLPLLVAHLRKTSVSSISETELEPSSYETSPHYQRTSNQADSSTESSRGIFSFSPAARNSNAQSYDSTTPRAVQLNLDTPCSSASVCAPAKHDTSFLCQRGKIVVTEVERYSEAVERGIKAGDVVEFVQAQPAALELLKEHEEALKVDNGHQVCIVFRCQNAEKRSSEKSSHRESLEEVHRKSSNASSETEFDADEALSALNPMWDPPPLKPQKPPQRSLRRGMAKRPARGVARNPRTLPASLPRPSRLKRRPVVPKKAVSSKSRSQIPQSGAQENNTSFLSKLFTLLVTIALLGVVFAVGYRAGSGSNDFPPILPKNTVFGAPASDTNPLAVSTVFGAPPYSNDGPTTSESDVRTSGGPLDLTRVEDTQDLILDRLDDLEDVMKKRTSAILRAKRKNERGCLAWFTSYVGNFFG